MKSKNVDKFIPSEWQGKSKYQVMATGLIMYIGFLGLVGTILYMLVCNF